MPGVAGVDRPSAALPTCLLRQRDAAFQRGLQAAELVEDLDRALKDGTLDTVDLFTDPGVRFGRAGGFCPAAEYRPGPSELLESADDGHDLDVDEDGALGLERDGQLTGKQGSVFASPDGTTTWLHAAGCVYHLVCPKVVNRITRWVYDRNGEI